MAGAEESVVEGGVGGVDYEVERGGLIGVLGGRESEERDNGEEERLGTHFVSFVVCLIFEYK